jgi:hypothetical protein
MINQKNYYTYVLPPNLAHKLPANAYPALLGNAVQCLSGRPRSVAYVLTFAKGIHEAR